MSSLSWNVKGLGSAIKWRLVKEYIKKSEADIIMLQESKLEGVDNKWVRSIWMIRDRQWVVMPSVGASRGQIIFRNKEVVESIEELARAYSLSIKSRNHCHGFI